MHQQRPKHQRGVIFATVGVLATARSISYSSYSIFSNSASGSSSNTIRTMRCAALAFHNCSAISARRFASESPLLLLLRVPAVRSAAPSATAATASFSLTTRRSRCRFPALVDALAPTPCVTTTTARSLSAGGSGSGTSSVPTGADMLAAFTRASAAKNDAPPPPLGRAVALAMHALATADAVCFDVDSTVIEEEGIDVLAAHLGQGPQVAALTRRAMEGGLPFHDALQARLDLLQPSRHQIRDCLARHPFTLTPHVEALVRALHAQHKHVYLVSGGFRLMIEPVAKRLDIDPTHNVYANRLLFHDDGLYAGFDATECTSRDQGKARALALIMTHPPPDTNNDRSSHHNPNSNNRYRTVVMIGDGATDAQAKPPAAAFIGYGGVVARAAVQSAADWFVTDLADLLHIVEQYGNHSNSATSGGQ